MRNNPDSSARLKINYIARDRALSLLQHYNHLVLDDPSLKGNELSPVNLSVNENRSKLFPKQRTPRLGHVFTEGISSISKTESPSFLMPRENVLHANLPKQVATINHKDQFGFALKSKRKKNVATVQPREPSDSKQMRMLGLQNVSLLDIGNQQKDSPRTKLKGDSSFLGSASTNNSVQLQRLHKGYKGGSVRNNVTSSLDSLESSQTSLKGKGDKASQISRANSKSKIMKGNVKLVSLGDQIEKYCKPIPKRFNPGGGLPQFDWRMRVQEQYRKARFEPGREIQNGMYSLTKQKKHTNVHNPVLPPIDFETNIPKRYPTYAGYRKVVVRGDESSSDRTTPKHYRKHGQLRITRSISPASSSTANSNQAPINPPPSFVSSSEEEYNRKDVISNMFTVLEEGVPLRIEENATDSSDDDKSTKNSRDLQSNVSIPTVVIGDGDMPLDSFAKSKVDKMNSKPKNDFKNPSPSRLGIPSPQLADEPHTTPQLLQIGGLGGSGNVMLNVPSISMATESMPPTSFRSDPGQESLQVAIEKKPALKTCDILDAIESQTAFGRGSQGNALRVYTEEALSNDADFQKLSVNNLNLLNSMTSPRSLVNVKHKPSGVDVQNDVKRENNSDEMSSQYSKVTTQSIVFQSPLAIAQNAKRL